mgnify:CR=1 FL=1
MGEERWNWRHMPNLGYGIPNFVSSRESVSSPVPIKKQELALLHELDYNPPPPF